MNPFLALPIEVRLAALFVVTTSGVTGINGPCDAVHSAHGFVMRRALRH